MKVVRFLLLAGILFGCGGKQDLNKTSENEPKGLTLAVNWLKDKEDAVDIGFRVINNYTVPIVIKEDAIQLTSNGEAPTRTVKGNKRFELAPSESKEGRITYDFDKGHKGGFKLLLTEAYKSKDGYTDANAQKIKPVELTL